MFCRSLARGWVETSSESNDMSSAETFESEPFEAPETLLRFLFSLFLAAEGLAHSGTGYSLSN